MSEAQIIRLAAAEWHDRRERDDWSKEDEAALQAWLGESPAHRIAFLRVDAAWKRADRLTALKSGGRMRRFVNLAQFWPAAIRLAAAAVVATAIGFAAVPYFKEKSNVQSYSTTVGGRETLALADGTQIELNTDTAVRVDISPERRLVWLDRGEAFFQVTHDANRPFVVTVGDRRITDIGTKFVIRRDESRMKVAVIEGEVELASISAQSGAPKLLKRGDVAVATGNTVAISRKTQRTLANELGWQRGVIVFDNVTLAEAASEFNRYNREKIVIADPAIAQITIGATLPANDVPAFARVAQKIFGLHVERQGQTIVISH